MAKQVINVGTSANDGTGDPNRTAFQKINANFTELYDAVDPANLISADADNSIVLGTDNKLWVEVSESSGGIPDAPNNANAYVRSALSWVVGYTKTAIDTLLGNKVDANAPITGTVKTKITYDSKGLVTSGADATTADIADSTDKRYVSDAQLTVIGNTSGTNTGDNATNSQYSGLATSKQDVLTDVNFGTFSTALTSKTTPVDADTVNLVDSADSNKARKLSFANLKEWVFSLINTTITSETGVYYFNDLFGALNLANDGFIATRVAGSNCNVFFNTGTIPNHQVNQSGVAQLKTGTTATGVAGIHIGEPVYNPSLVVGGGVISYKTSINIETLSTASERFWVGVGYNNGVFINPGLANTISFIYDEGGVITGNTSSPNWKIVTCNSSVRTFTDTGVAVSAGAWVKLEILINAAATSVEFFINNVSVGTISTNIPSGISKLMIINNQILKTIGTSSRNMYMDYVAYKQVFTTPRI